MKGSNPTRILACSQNKGLSDYQRRASLLHTGPSHTPLEAEAGVLQSDMEGKGQSRPQRPASSTKL